MRTQKLLLLVLGCAWALAASAQWQWLDKDGRKVFSDRPPPLDIPEKSILKQPPGRASPRTPVVAPAAGAEGSGEQPAAVAAAPNAAASAPKLATTDKDLEQKKKQAEDVEAAKRKAEEQKVAKARADNCNRAKAAKSTFESGVRVGRINAQGEREILDDAARASELKRHQSVIDADCK